MRSYILGGVTGPRWTPPRGEWRLLARVEWIRNEWSDGDEGRGERRDTTGRGEWLDAAPRHTQYRPASEISARKRAPSTAPPLHG